MNVADLIRRVWIVYFFLVTIFLINVGLFSALLLKKLGLLTDLSYRRLANFFTETTWCFYPKVLESEAGHRVIIYGDAPPKDDHVFVLANHVEAPDWSIVFWIAAAANHMGHVKIFAKKAISYVPLIGTGMQAMGTVFLSRSWDKDQQEIERTFRHLRDSNLPFWLVSHPEGTRLTPGKLKEAQDFASRNNQYVPKFSLVPRVKGFSATVAALRGRMTTILDVTLCWDAHCGPLPFFFFGQGGSRTVHALLRKYNVDDIPKDADGAAEWLKARWEEKDKLIEEFRATGKYGKAQKLDVKIPREKIDSALLGWQLIVAVLTVATLIWKIA